MEWKLRLSLVLCGIFAAALVSADLRCGNSLVEIGEWPVEVRESCGEPDYVATYPGTTIPGVGVVEEIEHWYYNRGPQQFIRRLEFRNDKLQRVETLGYGFTSGGPGPCSPAAIDSGTSEFELVARCGQPQAQRVEWRVLSAGNAHNIVGPLQGIVPVQEWLYEFGDSRFRRVVILRNGRVQRLEKADKPD